MSQPPASLKAYCFPGQGNQDGTLISQLSDMPACQHYRDVVYDLTAVDLNALIALPEAARNEAVKRNEIASLLTVLHALISLETLEGTAKPDYLAGYSVGQYVALHVAGCFDLEVLFALVWQRCLLMNEANARKPGRMAAIIGLQREAVQRLCDKHGLQISNCNARGQYTIAGHADDLVNAIKDSAEQGANKSILINTDGAWHSDFMHSAQAPFAELLTRFGFSTPRISVIDNVTGECFPEDPQCIKAQLVKHLSHTVCWEQGIRNLIEKNVRQFIEVGWGNMLTKFGFFISRDAEFLTTGQALKSEPCVA